MPKNFTAVLQKLLQNRTNLNVLRQLITPDAQYVSLSFDKPELKKVMPWAGTHTGLGKRLTPLMSAESTSSAVTKPPLDCSTPSDEWILPIRRRFLDFVKSSGRRHACSFRSTFVEIRV